MCLAHSAKSVTSPCNTNLSQGFVADRQPIKKTGLMTDTSSLEVFQNPEHPSSGPLASLLYPKADALPRPWIANCFTVPRSPRSNASDRRHPPLPQNRGYPYQSPDTGDAVHARTSGNPQSSC